MRVVLTVPPEADTSETASCIEVSVVMPCLNEARTVGRCVDKALTALREMGVSGEVIIADNGSSDGSPGIAYRQGAHVIHVERKGYGSALQAGIAVARGRFVIMGDADDSYDFSRLEPFVAQLRRGYDLVMGNRFQGGIRPGAMPWSHRYIGNPVLTGILNLFFHTPIHDAHCGLRGFRKDAYDQLDLRTPGMEFASEMVVKAWLSRQKVTEVPTVLHPDGRDRPPHLRSFRDGWRHLRFLLLMRFFPPSKLAAPSGNRFPNLLSLLLIFLLAANYFAPFADLDYTWQIRTGERIVQTGQLRPTDAFTYTIAGNQVPDFEWLYEVILCGVWKVWGYGGLKLLRTVAVGVPLLILGLRLRKEAVPWPGILATFLLAVLVLSSGWNLRPLYCTTIGLLLLTGWLHDHCIGRKPLPLWLPIVMLLWANLHPGVIVGQGLLAGAIAWEWLNRLFRLNPPLARAACWRLTWIGGLGLAATFLSPNPWERLLFPFRPDVSHPIQRIFVEMQPLYVFLARPPFTVALVYVIAALVALTVARRFASYRLWETALLVGLAILANVAVRSLQDWFLVMLLLGVPHLAAYVRERGNIQAFGFVTDILRIPACRFQWFWPALAVSLLAIASLIPPLARRMPIQDARDWPVAALNWAEAHEVRGRFFAPPDYGSYLTWRLGNNARCYVDTRGFFFPGELIEDSHLVPQLASDWQPRLERVLAAGTDFFLLETTGARGQLWQRLRPHVGQPLYCDNQAVLLTATQVTQALADSQDTLAKRQPD